MYRLLADHNFHGAILRGLIRDVPSVDILRVRDVGMAQSSDPDILEWAAAEDRIILTHDRQTFPMFAYDRLAAGGTFPGVIVIAGDLSVGSAIRELAEFLHCSDLYEWRDQVVFIPLRPS